MANRETAVANSYESTLSASLDAGGTTINVATTDGTPGVPFYLVIDPGEDASREVILVDQGKTGSTFTLSSASSRGQDGTSDVDHTSSAVIGAYPIAALWRDINDRVDEHSHSGGSDGAQISTSDLSGHNKSAHDALGIEHDSLSGLGDDDHPQYLNGARHDARDHTDALDSTSFEDHSDGDELFELTKSTSAVNGSTHNMTTSFVDFVDFTFTPPASWGNYEISAVSAGVNIRDIESPDSHQARVVVGGTTNSSVSHGTGEAFKPLFPGLDAPVTGLSGNTNCALQVSSNNSEGQANTGFLTVHARRTS